MRNMESKRFSVDNVHSRYVGGVMDSKSLPVNNLYVKLPQQKSLMMSPQKVHRDHWKYSNVPNLDLYNLPEPEPRTRRVIPVHKTPTPNRP